MSSLLKSIRKIFHEKNSKSRNSRSHNYRRHNHNQKAIKKSSKSSNLTTVSTLVHSNKFPGYISYGQTCPNNSNNKASKNNSSNSCDVQMCLSDASNQQITSGSSSIIETNESERKAVSNFNNPSLGSSSINVEQLTNIKKQLLQDYDVLSKRNKKLQSKHDETKTVNNNLRKRLLELQELNERLLAENAEVLQVSIKNRFLKLESEDLTKKTTEYKEKLEEKENAIVKFQKQYEVLRFKNNIAFKQREEALLEASHANRKLEELSKDCANLDIYKCENIQRRFYFNELQTLLGNIRVYFKVNSTIDKSCLSFISDDKILLKMQTDCKSKKPKNLICRFTKVFQPHNSNDEIFEEIQPLLLTVIDGFNCSFISYGQAGTNKSLMLLGDSDNDYDGLVHQTLSFLVKAIDDNHNWDYSIFLSAVLINRNDVYDVFKKHFVEIVDDGSNLIMKCTEEYQVRSEVQIENLLTVIRKMKDKYLPCAKLTSSYSHLLIIIRVVGNCKMNDEKTAGIAMFCETADFKDEMDLILANREDLKEEKILNHDLLDLAKILSKFKRINETNKACNITPPNCMLTKLLYPCFDRTAKICLLIHCLSDEEHFCNIYKSIQFGLMAMPKNKEDYSNKNKLKHRALTSKLKSTVIWQFNDNKS